MQVYHRKWKNLTITWSHCYCVSAMKFYFFFLLSVLHGDDRKEVGKEKDIGNQPQPSRCEPLTVYTTKVDTSALRLVPVKTNVVTAILTYLGTHANLWQCKLPQIVISNWPFEESYSNNLKIDYWFELIRLRTGSSLFVNILERAQYWYVFEI